MWLVFTWMAILAADLLIWALCRRFYRLHLLGYRLSLLHRSLIVDSRPNDDGAPPKEVPERIRRMLATDDQDANGLVPSSSVQIVVNFTILLQNSLVMGIVGGENPLREVCRRSGQLALTNTIPLVLLAFPNIALSRIVRQSTPEVIWIHHLFGWLVWLNTIVHAGLSNAIAANSVTMAFSIFGISGAVFLYMALLSKVRIAPIVRVSRPSLITSHSILGAAFLAAVFLHTPSNVFSVVVCISITFFVVGILSRNTTTVPVKIKIDHTDVTKIDDDEIDKDVAKFDKETQYIISCSMDNVKVADGQACYFEVNGKPVKVAWTNRPFDGITSHSVALIVDLLPEEVANIRNQEIGAVVRGPFYSFLSPYVQVTNRLDIFCSRYTFPEAHEWLHARKMKQNESITYVVVVAPPEGFLEHFFLKHQCPYREYVKSIANMVGSPEILRSGTIAKKKEITSVPVWERKSFEVDIENPPDNNDMVSSPETLRSRTNAKKKEITSVLVSDRESFEVGVENNHDNIERDNMNNYYGVEGSWQEQPMRN